MNFKVEVQRFFCLTLVIYLIITLFLAVGVVVMLLLYQLQENRVVMDEKTFSLKMFFAIIFMSIKTSLPLALIFSANLQYQHLKACKKLGIVSKAVDTTAEAEITVPMSSNEAFEWCKNSLSSLINEKVVYGVNYKQNYEIFLSDPLEGVLEVKTSFFSESNSSVSVGFLAGRRKKGKGENITFRLSVSEDGKTNIHIKSSARLLFGLVDFGQNQINIANLQNFFKTKLI